MNLLDTVVAMLIYSKTTLSIKVVKVTPRGASTLEAVKLRPNQQNQNNRDREKKT